MSVIFRQKSLDQISSPEQLDDYMRVTTPGLWLFMVATGVFLAGLAFWLLTVSPF